MGNILIFGSGFVGGATGKGLAKHGNNVTFLDVDPNKIEELRAEDYNASLVEDFDSNDWDIAMVTVPTPTVRGKISLDYVKDASSKIGSLVAAHEGYPVIVVRSTVPPGTTESTVLPIIEERSGKKLGHGFGLVMQPEYLRQVSAESDFERPWHVLIGELDRRGADAVESLYLPFNAPIERVTAAEAEMQKYVHNIFNAVKIAFFNEMRSVCNKENLDSQKIFHAVAQSCEGIWNGMYGLRDFGAFDGACLPKDTQAFLDWGVPRGHRLGILDAVIIQNKNYATEQATRKTTYGARETSDARDLETADGQGRETQLEPVRA